MTPEALSLTIIGATLAATGGLTSFLLTILWSTSREHSKRIRDLEIRCAERHRKE